MHSQRLTNNNVYRGRHGETNVVYVIPCVFTKHLPSRNIEFVKNRVLRGCREYVGNILRVAGDVKVAYCITVVCSFHAATQVTLYIVFCIGMAPLCPAKEYSLYIQYTSISPDQRRLLDKL